MTEADYKDAVRDAGLPGWKASIRFVHNIGRYVAVLTSPDYDPVRNTGFMKAATGRDAAAAFAGVLEVAQGAARPAPSLH